MKKIIVGNKYTERPIIKNDLPNYPDTYDIIEEDEFINLLPNLSDAVILGYGYEFYQKLRELHNNGRIHIGLRNFRYNDFKNLQIVHIGSNKLVFGAYPVENSDPIYHPKTQSWTNSDAKLEYFFSPSVERDPVPLPETHCVGLKEGINILKSVFLTHIGEDVGFDFETSGFPQDYGFKVSGFSLSSKSRMISYFFDFRKDYNYRIKTATQDNIKDYSEFLRLTYEYLKLNSQHIWTYNCAFEIHVCLMLFHEFIPLQDTYALCIADDLRGSLKYNVQYYLQAPSWDDVLDKQQEYIGWICDPNNGGFNNYNEFKLTLDNWDTLDEEGNYTHRQGHENLDEIMLEYRDNPSWLPLLEEYWGDPWFACDPDQLGVYCCYDSYYTVAIKDVLYPFYGNNCYKTFLYDRYLGVELKTHGIVVNTDRRRKLEKFCNKITTNFYIYTNKFLLNLRVKKLKDYEKYPINDSFRRLLGNKIPGTEDYYISKLASTVVSNNPVYLGKTIFAGVMPPDVIDTINKGQPVRTDFMNDILGFDFTDELSGINNYEWYDFASFNRKRSMISNYGSMFYKLFGIDNLRLQINNDALEVIKSDLTEYLETLNNSWVYRDTIPITDSKFRTFITLWDLTNNKYNPDRDKITKAEFFSILLKDAGINIEVDDAMIKCLNSLPQDLHDELILYAYPPVIDMSINPMSESDLSDWIPESILSKYPDLPNIYKLWDYYSAKLELEKLSKLNNSILDDQGHLEEVDRYYNYFSPKQWNEFLLEISDYAAKWQYIGDIFLDLVAKGEVELTWETYLKLLADTQPYIESEKFLNSDIYRNYKQYPSIDTIGFFVGGFYKRADMNTELKDEDIYLQLTKLMTLRRLAATTRKISSNYIKALHETVVKPHRVYNKICQFEYVDGYDESENDLRLLYDYQINRMDTKRTGSGYHTWRGYSDYNFCLTVEPGYVCTYFDISQAEPRSIAYFSNDPSFRGAYESGKDAYMELAKVTWPEHVNDPNFREVYRPVAKTSLIAKIYGRGDAGLAESCEVPVETVTKMGKALFDNWKEVARLREHKLNYTSKTGYVETFLGDRLSGDSERAYTTAVNYPNQGNTACILMEGFENSVLNIRNNGYEIYTQTIIHDSNTNMIRVRDLPEVDLCYRRYFRKYIQERYDVDYKYDVDLLVNFRDHISYNLDIDTHTVSLNGPENDIRYLVDEFKKSRKITIVKEELKVKTDNHFDNMVEGFDRNHVLCDDPEFNQNNKLYVEFTIDEPIAGEELINVPLGEEYYFNTVKKWNEHVTPGGEAEDLKLGIVDNPNKIYPAEEANRFFNRR